MSKARRVSLTLLIGVVVVTVICLFAGFRYAYLYVFAAFPALLIVLSIVLPGQGGADANHSGLKLDKTIAQH